MNWMRAFMILLALSISGPVAAGEYADIAFRAKVASFIDSWHDDAAHARLAYFDKIAEDGIFIGTDRTERWDRAAFLEWARPYFARPSAWTFHAINRHVYFNADKSVIWFDEQLESRLGLCQASGVIRRDRDRFRIAHYQLSLAVPNEIQPQLSELIAKAAGGAAPK